MRIPLISKLKDAKTGAQGLVYSQAANVATMLYSRARKNFLVLADGLKSGVVLPKIEKKCRKFCKDNAKEWKRFDKECKELAGMEEIFERIEDADYSKEDGIWIEQTFIPFLESKLNQDKMELLKLVKR